MITQVRGGIGIAWHLWAKDQIGADCLIGIDNRRIGCFLLQFRQEGGVNVRSACVAIRAAIRQIVTAAANRLINGIW